MEGTELLKAIHDHVPRTVKIIIIGYPSTENADKAQELKADAYVIKPVEPERLLRTIREKPDQQQVKQ
jgi:two-component SAPR family response regulator